MRLKAARKYRI